MVFDALVARNVRRSGFAALVTIVAIALGVAGLYVAQTMGSAARAALVATVAGFGEPATFTIANGTRRLDEASLARLRAVPGVRMVRPVLSGTIAPRDRPSDRIDVVGIDAIAAFPGSSTLREREVGPWSPPTIEDRLLVGANGALVSSRFAALRRLRVGSSWPVLADGKPVVLKVVAILDRPSPRLDPHTVIVDERTAQRFFDAPSRLDRIEIVADDPKAPPQTMSRLRRRLVELVPRTATVVRTADLIAELERSANAFDLALRLVAVLALAVATVLAANAIDLSVRRRGPDIATLRMLGATRSAIFRAFLLEGFTIGAFGALVGAIAGDAFAVSAGAYAAADASLLGRDVLLGVALATIASALPAIRVARARPAVVWRRFDRPFVAARGGGTTFGAIARLPFFARHAIRNLRAHGRRASLGLVALATAVAASTCVGVTAASFARTADVVLARSLAGDLVIEPLPGYRATDARTLRRIAALPGVASVRETDARAFSDGSIVRVRPGANVADVRSAIRHALAPSAFVVRSQSDVRAATRDALDGSFALIRSLGFGALALALCGAAITFASAVSEREREHAVLRVLGLRAVDLRRAIVTEASLLGFASGGVGVGSGVLLSAGLVVIDRLAFGWSVSFAVPVLTTLTSLGVVVLASAVGALLPAERIARSWRLPERATP